MAEVVAVFLAAFLGAGTGAFAAWYILKPIPIELPPRKIDSPEPKEQEAVEAREVVGFMSPFIPEHSPAGFGQSKLIRAWWLGEGAAKKTAEEE